MNKIKNKKKKITKYHNNTTMYKFIQIVMNEILDNKKEI